MEKSATDNAIPTELQVNGNSDTLHSRQPISSPFEDEVSPQAIKSTQHLEPTEQANGKHEAEGIHLTEQAVDCKTEI
jgi:hypothetical protein